MSAYKLTTEQVAFARHALGLPNDDNRSYRNRYYVGSTGDRYMAWMEMVANGLACRSTEKYFYLTRAGAEAVLANGETLCPEDFPVPSLAKSGEGG